MKRALLIALALATTADVFPNAPVLAAPVRPVPSAKPAAEAGTAALRAKTADAPADEYFGPFKYSAISTRTKIGALGRAYQQRWADDASIVHDAGLLESAYRAWAEKYPKDVWLAPTAFHLAQLYNEVQTQEARDHAKSWFAYIAKTFPGTKEAHSARLRLQQGFPPFHSESPVNPTPSPYGPGVASPAASTGPSPASTSPAPGPAASPAAGTVAPAPASAKPIPAPSPTR